MSNVEEGLEHRLVQVKLERVHLQRYSCSPLTEAADKANSVVSVEEDTSDQSDPWNETAGILALVLLSEDSKWSWHVASGGEDYRIKVKFIIIKFSGIRFNVRYVDRYGTSKFPRAVLWVRVRNR